MPSTNDRMRQLITSVTTNRRLINCRRRSVVALHDQKSNAINCLTNCRTADQLTQDHFFFRVVCFLYALSANFVLIKMQLVYSVLMLLNISTNNNIVDRPSTNTYKRRKFCVVVAFYNMYFFFVCVPGPDQHVLVLNIQHRIQAEEPKQHIIQYYKFVPSQPLGDSGFATYQHTGPQ